jgi:hypothetical protein
MGLTPHLRVDVQRHFFRCFAIVENLQGKPIDLRAGTIVERGQRGLLALGGLGDQLSPLLLVDLPRRFQRHHQHRVSPTDLYERTGEIGFMVWTLYSDCVRGPDYSTG